MIVLSCQSSSIDIVCSLLAISQFNTKHKPALKLLVVEAMLTPTSDLDEAYTSQVKGESTDVKFDFYK